VDIWAHSDLGMDLDCYWFGRMV